MAPVNNFSKVDKFRVYSPELGRMVDQMTKNGIVYDAKKAKFVTRDQADDPNIEVRNQVYQALRREVLKELAQTLKVDPRLVKTTVFAGDPIDGALLAAMPSGNYTLKDVNRHLTTAVGRAEGTAREALRDLERQTGQDLDSGPVMQHGSETAARFLFDTSDGRSDEISVSQKVLTKAAGLAVGVGVGAEMGQGLERVLERSMEAAPAPAPNAA